MIVNVSDIHLKGMRFLVTRADQRKVNYSQLVTNFSWSDSVNVAGAEATIETVGPDKLVTQIGMEGSTGSVSAMLPDVRTGRIALTEVWRGYFDEVVDEHSSENLMRQITAYDSGRLLADHEEDYVFRDLTLSQIVTRVVRDLELPVGSVATTSRPLGNIVGRGEAVWSLLQKAVQKHKNLTGETYRLMFSQGRMQMVLQGSQTHWWVFEIGRSLTTVRRTRSTTDIENRVRIYGATQDDLQKAKIEATVEDVRSQQIYGLRGRVEYLSDAEDRKRVVDLARERIRERAIPDETLEISGFGVPLRGGEKVRVIDRGLGITSIYYVEQVECSWSSDSSETLATLRKEPVDPGLFMDQLVVA